MTLPPKTLFRAPSLAWWLATGFGSGYLKPAPGTWGSFAGLWVWFFLVTGVSKAGWEWGPAMLVSAPLWLTALAVWSSAQVVKETGEKDPSYIVIDEWAGMWFALTPLLFALSLHPTSLTSWMLRMTAPFLLFRLFDIWKPGLIDKAQNLPGGWGVVMDDVLAGLLAALLTLPLDRWLK